MWGKPFTNYSISLLLVQETFHWAIFKQDLDFISFLKYKLILVNALNDENNFEALSAQ
jgi:hypothetical protein